MCTWYVYGYVYMWGVGVHVCLYVCRWGCKWYVYMWGVVVHMCLYVYRWGCTWYMNSTYICGEWEEHVCSYVFMCM